MVRQAHHEREIGMLKLWGRKNSSNVKKVMWTCAELGVPYERVDVGGPFGGLSDENYKAMNPMSLIPVIEDDGFVLWESNAIVRYLCSKHPNAPFYPSDLKVRAQADRWMEWQSTTLGPALGPAFVQIVRFKPEDRDMKMIATNIEKAAGLWKIVDRQLGATKWLTGDALTIGDVPLGILLYTWDQLKLEDVGLAHHREKLPNLWRWYEQMQANQHYRDVVMIGLS
jgi:glutathione S-transferase